MSWRFLLGLAGVLGLAAVTVLAATAPRRLPPGALDGLAGDPTRGRQIFLAGGCASCHAAPDATRATRLVLAGGRGFVSPFGTFYAPNISSDPVAGIGRWSAEDLANALLRGTSPEGAHYYPAFPYTSYRLAEPGDIVALRAYLATLPADPTPSQRVRSG